MLHEPLYGATANEAALVGLEAIVAIANADAGVWVAHRHYEIGKLVLLAFKVQRRRAFVDGVMQTGRTGRRREQIGIDARRGRLVAAMVAAAAAAPEADGL